jgi:2-polyprenyl-6-hydroxyphenyl methylase/3-demethylubiquinone-9 3-methyltransferase
MDAADLGFCDGCFDLVACIQNGISAFNVDPERLIREALRVARPGGSVLFSSYSEKFWPERLDWFRIQSDQGLLGEIDEEATGNGVIICKDGFRATTVGPDDFLALAEKIAVDTKITEVGESSIFCEIVK